MWRPRPGLDGNQDICLDDYHDGADDLGFDDNYDIRIVGNRDLGDLGHSRHGFEFFGDNWGPAGRGP